MVWLSDNYGNCMFERKGDYIWDVNGNRTFEIRGQYIFDMSGNRLLEFRGSYIFDIQGNRLHGVTSDSSQKSSQKFAKQKRLHKSWKRRGK